jgi:hypothetical protein
MNAGWRADQGQASPRTCQSSPAGTGSVADTLRSAAKRLEPIASMGFRRGVPTVGAPDRDDVPGVGVPVTIEP